ncbi:MAG: hypothetical protein V1744_05805 [Candidatus Altiarchaeota archaeon]
MISLDYQALPQLAHDLAILVIYLIVGMGIKYIDQAFDLKVFNKKTATAVAVPIAILMGLLMVYDPPSASIFTAIALGVAATNKVDNIAFSLGLATLIIIPILLGHIIQIMWIPFILLLIAAVIDEKGNDWSDKYYQRKRKDMRTKTKTLAFLFSHRFTMKITVLILVAVNQMPPAYLAAFILFDLGYSITEKISFTLIPYRLKNPNIIRKENWVLFN